MKKTFAGRSKRPGILIGMISSFTLGGQAMKTFNIINRIIIWILGKIGSQYSEAGSDVARMLWAA